MTLQEEINNLTWFDLINKLKSTLKRLNPFTQNQIDAITNATYPNESNPFATLADIPSGGSGVRTVTGINVSNTDPLNPIINDSRPYKVYTALLTQTGTNSPTVDILENNLGFTIIWSRTSPGFYQTQILTAPKNKIWYYIKTSPSEAKESTIYFNINKLLIQTYSITSGSINTVDNKLDSTPIEIRFYN